MGSQHDLRFGTQKCPFSYSGSQHDLRSVPATAAAAAGNNVPPGSRPLSNHVPRGCTKPFPNPPSDYSPNSVYANGVPTRVIYPVECGTPPWWLYVGSFLLLFTTLLHRTMHFVETRAALGPLFTVKHNTFEHSNGPLALRAPWAPGLHK